MPDFYDSQHSQNEGVVLASSLMGEPVGIQTAAAAAMEAEGSTIAPAAGQSTRPYKAPKTKRHDADDKPLCDYEDCKAYSMKKFPVCPGHARKLGLVPRFGPNKEINKRLAEEFVPNEYSR